MAVSRPPCPDHGIVSLREERLPQVAFLMFMQITPLRLPHRDSNFDVFVLLSLIFSNLMTGIHTHSFKLQYTHHEF